MEERPVGQWCRARMEARLGWTTVHYTTTPPGKGKDGGKMWGRRAIVRQGLRGRRQRQSKRQIITAKHW